MQNAVYGETAALNANANRFSENVTGYDRNGNIKSLQRFGQTGASSYGLTDNLTFHLDGNRLNRVDDAVSASAYNGGSEFRDGAKQAGEYAYDANGNLTKDLNKVITVIQYNFLNLPSTVTFGDGSAITYTYAADGTKLRTVHKASGVTVTTDYCGNVIYENGTQKLLLTEKGYVTLADGKYHYYLKDHQGNNRVVINHSGTAEEVNHYYPFGGTFAGTGSVQPYKYNGKELDARKGLNWYDYGARHYDAALGRFTTADPLAEKYYGISPYAYCNNNPVRFIDPDGGKIVDLNGKVITYQDGKWSSNVTDDVRIVGMAMMRNKVGLEQFTKMMDAEHPITITLQLRDFQKSGRLGVTKVRSDGSGNIERADIILYTDEIDDMANTLPYRQQGGEIVERYQKNLDTETLKNITFEDVLGATGTHESVHALDKKSNHVGESDKLKREYNPIEKEIDFIKEIINH